ncbi:hypothetical protein HYALB_00000887 [Hymenoscyphus albidus]|uniref:Uncharacterized protein n=1 Tax=Hymenoscyphus albidus TaxID=595503 RepID=A0A9N9LBT5_9HELO|nr:hypothetical protein HYALB_00000887 [Hymenoscyphus albidus]
MSPRPWDETIAGLSSTIQIIELNEKLEIVEGILELDLHNSWDRNHKVVLLDVCSHAYRTEKTLVEVVASTHRGIENGTETQKNLRVWTENLRKAEEESRKAEGAVENLRQIFWDVVFDTRKAATIFGSREWSEAEKQLIQKRREDFRRACRRIENLKDEIKDLTVQEKIMAANRGESLLIAFHAPKSMIFPPENKYDSKTQSSSDTIRNKERDAGLLPSIGGKSSFELADLTAEQRREYEDIQERRLAMKLRAEDRMQRYHRYRQPPEPDFEISASESEVIFANSKKVKRTTVKSRPIDEELERYLSGACQPIVYTGYTSERARKFGSTSFTPFPETEENISPLEVANLIAELEVSENLKAKLPDTSRNEIFRQRHDNQIGILQEQIIKAREHSRKERRGMAREREERIVVSEGVLKHKLAH